MSTQALVMISRFRLPDGQLAADYTGAFPPDIIAEVANEADTQMLALRWRDGITNIAQKMQLLNEHAVNLVPGIEFDRMTGYSSSPAPR